MAVLALAGVFQINRRSALGAAYLADLRPDPLEFRRSQAANKLLLPQELKEGREAPVAPQAPEIGEPPRLAQVEAERKCIAAARATQMVCHRLTGVTQVGTNFLEQFDNSSGRELDASQVVEPDSGAGKAEIHPHGAMVVLFEILGLHRLSTVRAGDRGKGINVGHGVASRQGRRVTKG